MTRPEIVYQLRKAGGGTIWVHRRRGGRRAITFDSGCMQLAKLLGLAGVLGRIGSATTTVVGGQLVAAQLVPCTEGGTPAAPRDGPVCGPVQISGP